MNFFRNIFSSVQCRTTFMFQSEYKTLSAEAKLHFSGHKNIRIPAKKQGLRDDITPDPQLSGFQVSVLYSSGQQRSSNPSAFRQCHGGNFPDNPPEPETAGQSEKHLFCSSDRLSHVSQNS